MGRKLSNLLLNRDYHQRVKPANHWEPAIILVLLMDNLIPIRRRTSLQRELQKIQLLGYQTSSITFLGRVTLFQPACGNPWNTLAAVSNFFLESMRRVSDRNTNMNNSAKSRGPTREWCLCGQSYGLQ